MEKVIIENCEAKNVYGSSCDRSNAGWINDWERVTGRTANKCVYLGCGNEAEVGGHLYLKRYSVNYTYLAPICYSCNNSKEGEYFGIKKNTAFIKKPSNACYR
jgi:hypothetical protein